MLDRHAREEVCEAPFGAGSRTIEVLRLGLLDDLDAVADRSAVQRPDVCRRRVVMG